MNQLEKTKAVFEGWALTDRVEQMKAGHTFSVNTYLDAIQLDTQNFSFLDVGCGDGWVVRKLAQAPSCQQAVGIDLCDNMIHLANQRTRSDKEKFICNNFLQWQTQQQFDLIFSMESLYYMHPLEQTLTKLHEMLTPQGRIIVGTDLYHENPVSAGWPDMLDLKMDFRSKHGWQTIFENIGFNNVQLSQLTNPNGQDQWQQECGTLFISAHK